MVARRVGDASIHLVDSLSLLVWLMLLIGLAPLFCVGWTQLFCTNGACDCESTASHTLDDYKKMFNDYIADQVLLFLMLTLLLLLLHKLFILAL